MKESVSISLLVIGLAISLFYNYGAYHLNKNLGNE